MNRRIGLIAIAVVLALVGTFAVYSYAHNADKRAVDATRSATVLIAQKGVPAGTTWGDAIKAGYFIEQKIPAGSAPSSAVGSLNASVPVEQVATAAIASGQIVLRPMFAVQGPVTGALAIPKGKLAISVTMASNADVAGFVQPLSEVGIFVTFKLDKASKGATAVNGAVGGTDLYVTKLLLARVTVIATSQLAPTDVAGAKGGGGGGGGVLVTLALTQQQAQQVILAQQTGQLYLGLLSDNSVTTPDGGVINAGVFKPTPIFVK